MKKIAILFIALLACGCSQAWSQPSRPDDYGSITSYPVPAGEGGGSELEYCYRYSKRVWELGSLLRDKQLKYEKAREIVTSALGKLGAAEDIADIDGLRAGEYQSPEQMAGVRFHGCGKALKLPMEERHKDAAALCFQSLRLPRYAANQRQSGKTSQQVEAALKSSNAPDSHPAIEKAVALVYSRKSAADLDRAFKDIFLRCIVRAGESQ